jgi:geranylgeranylglycerol-phosphate geranylgeranyltransferase
MKLFQLLFFIFNIVHIKSFVPLNVKNGKSLFQLNHNNTPVKRASSVPFKQKILGVFKLIRAENIIPTTFLCFSGGWISNPSFSYLLHSPSFIVSTINTLLIMSSSMILNDLFDIPLDKINNPQRPLIVGDVKIVEAIWLTAILLGASECLSFIYLPTNLQMVIHLAIANIVLYTPVFKRITLLKNISCAGLIAFSVFFSGLAANSHINFPTIMANQNLGLLLINTQTIFFGSLYIEILLDMCDVEGDKQNGIKTLPVLYGNKIAFEIANSISRFNALLSFMTLSIIYNFKVSATLLLLYSPLLRYLKMIKTYGFTKENIKKNANKTTLPLFLVLIYFCVLSVLPIS